LGWQSLSGCALAGNAASGGIALAQVYALGPLAHAAQANKDVARNLAGSNRFFAFAKMICDYFLPSKSRERMPLNQHSTCAVES
jgi:hypothetical protein